MLADLLEEEKREQEKQGREQQASINNEMANANSSSLLSEHDFERLISGGQSMQTQGIPAQGLLPVQHQQQQPNQQQPSQQQQPMMQNPVQQRQVFVGQNAPRPQFVQRTITQQHAPAPPVPHMQNPGPNMSTGMEAVGGSGNSAGQTMVRKEGCSVPMFVANLQKPPSVPPDSIVTEQDRQIQLNYEQWLRTQDEILSKQRSYYEEEVSKLRKSRKALNSKQRQLKKSGNDLPENDTLELNKVTEEQTIVQKQLENARKQSRQHSTVMKDYNSKQQAANMKSNLARQQMTVSNSHNI